MKEQLRQITLSIGNTFPYSISIPTLNEVLFWFEKSKYKYAHFEVGHFFVYNGEDPEPPIKWDIKKPYLKDQDPALIEFLFEEILPCFNTTE